MRCRLCHAGSNHYPDTRWRIIHVRAVREPPTRPISYYFVQTFRNYLLITWTSSRDQYTFNTETGAVVWRVASGLQINNSSTIVSWPIISWLPCCCWWRWRRSRWQCTQKSNINSSGMNIDCYLFYGTGTTLFGYSLVFELRIWLLVFNSRSSSLMPRNPWCDREKKEASYCFSPDPLLSININLRVFNFDQIIGEDFLDEECITTDDVSLIFSITKFRCNLRAYFSFHQP